MIPAGMSLFALTATITVLLKYKKKLAKARLIFAFLSGAGLAGAGVGWLSGMLGGLSAVMTALLFLATLILAGVDLIDGKADWMALGAAMLLLPVGVMLGGAVGEFSSTAASGLTQLTSNAAAAMFGVDLG